MLFGDPVKQSAQAKVLERKWLRFLLVHGEAYKFVARVGPTVELVEHFVAYAFCTRDSVSGIGRERAWETRLNSRFGTCSPSPSSWRSNTKGGKG